MHLQMSFSFFSSYRTACKTHREASFWGLLILVLWRALVYSSVLGPNKHVMWSAVLGAHAADSQGWFVMTISIFILFSITLGLLPLKLCSLSIFFFSPAEWGRWRRLQRLCVYFRYGGSDSTFLPARSVTFCTLWTRLDCTWHVIFCKVSHPGDKLLV